MSKILFVEDDPVLGRGLNVNFELEGYQVEWVQNLRDASTAQSAKPFDLMILDLGLPDGDGLEFLKSLRQGGSNLPVVILTAKTDEDSVVEGLQSGANDYVRKPFGKRELFARIQTVLRKPQSNAERLNFDDLSITREQRRAIYRGKEIELNRREFEILSYFVEHAEAVVTRAALLQALNTDGGLSDRTIDSHISHLRARLRQAEVTELQITSIYGVGYRLEKK